MVVQKRPRLRDASQHRTDHAVRDHDALGLAGRTGHEQNLRDRLTADAPGGGARRRLVRQQLCVVERTHPPRRLGDGDVRRAGRNRPHRIGVRRAVAREHDAGAHGFGDLAQAREPVVRRKPGLRRDGHDRDARAQRAERHHHMIDPVAGQDHHRARLRRAERAQRGADLPDRAATVLY